jgi:hypothetical protein
MLHTLRDRRDRVNTAISAQRRRTAETRAALRKAREVEAQLFDCGVDVGMLKERANLWGRREPALNAKTQPWKGPLSLKEANAA